jgi:hypothetical protein
MNYYLDTEFREGMTQRTLLGFKVGKPVPTIDLISLGCVSEDGRELYVLNKEHDLSASWNAQQEDGQYWLRENVLRAIYNENVSAALRHHMPFSLEALQTIFRDTGRTRADIGYQLLIFTQPEAYDHWTGSMDTFYTSYFAGNEPVFYTHYGDYDWVVTMQCFGTMMMKPKSFPYLAQDLQQMQLSIGLTNEQRRELCPQNENEHNALADARWNHKLHQALRVHAQLLAAQSEERIELDHIRRILDVPALGNHTPSKKVAMLLDHVQRAARGEKISNRLEDYR